MCIPDPFPATLVDSVGLTTVGASQISFAARDGNTITAYTYRSSTFDPGQDTVLFVMHGSSRNASDYRDRFAAIAERNDALVIAPEFDDTRYPSSDDYTLGVGTMGAPYGEPFDPSEWRSTEDSLYAELEHVFEAVRTSLQISACEYRVTGHSAGAQFAHRALTFLPDARVRTAVAMNAGWYTLLAEDPPTPPGTLSDANLTMPYGLRGTPPSIDRATTMAHSLVVLLGTADTDTPAQDPNVRGTPEAMAQGDHRLARGHFYFDHAEAEAAALGTPFGFRVAEMPFAGHSSTEMAQSAGWMLFAADTAQPCTPSLAADVSLAITEVLVRPDTDANGDGSSADPDAEDEFIEIVNAGTTPACLTGWRIGDVTNPERHRVAVGPALAPGAALVVFGGGIPTGPFGGADVEWAAFSSRLGLNNGGDVITLADGQDTVALQLSWGDCSMASCASEHVPGSAVSGVSWARASGTSGAWVLHDTLGSVSFSPGTDAALQPWVP
jgi:poly(3-hydroxybutyrate) depolymerase